MPIYRVDRQVDLAEGSQTFEVHANSKEDALKKLKRGEGDMILDETEVITLGDYDLSDVYEVEDD